MQPHADPKEISVVAPSDAAVSTAVKKEVQPEHTLIAVETAKEVPVKLESVKAETPPAEIKTEPEANAPAEVKPEVAPQVEKQPEECQLKQETAENSVLTNDEAAAFFSKYFSESQGQDTEYLQQPSFMQPGDASSSAVPIPFGYPFSPFSPVGYTPGMPAMTPYPPMSMRPMPGSTPPTPQPSRSLWVGSLHPETTDDELRSTFSSFGLIDSVKLLPQKNCCFIKFEDIPSCIRAYHAMQGHSIHGQPVKLGWGKADPSDDKVPPPPCKNLWVGNVHPDATEEELQQIFHPFGQIERIRVLPTKNCAFVNFASVEMAIVAKSKMQGKMCHGLPLKINFGKDLTTSQYSTMPSKFLKAEELPPPRVPPPQDKDVRNVLEKMAEFVVRDGISFEEMIITKEKDNPKMSFLSPTDPNHAYYRWRVFELTEKPNDLQSGTTLTLPGTGVNTTATSKLTSSDTPAVVHAPPAIQTVQVPLSDEDTTELKSRLASLGPTKASIKNTKHWIIDRPKNIVAIANILKSSIDSSTAVFDHRLNVIYVINDILQHGLQKRNEKDLDDFSAAFHPSLARIFRVSFKGESQSNQEKILRVLQIWSDKGIYEKAFVDSLRSGAIAADRLLHKLSPSSLHLQPGEPSPKRSKAQLMSKFENFMSELSNPSSMEVDTPSNQSHSHQLTHPQQTSDDQEPHTGEGGFGFRGRGNFRGRGRGYRGRGMFPSWGPSSEPSRNGLDGHHSHHRSAYPTREDDHDHERRREHSRDDYEHGTDHRSHSRDQSPSHHRSHRDTTTSDSFRDSVDRDDYRNKSEHKDRDRDKNREKGQIREDREKERASERARDTERIEKHLEKEAQRTRTVDSEERSKVVLKAQRSLDIPKDEPSTTPKKEPIGTKSHKDPTEKEPPNVPAKAPHQHSPDTDKNHSDSVPAVPTAEKEPPKEVPQPAEPDQQQPKPREHKHHHHHKKNKEAPQPGDTDTPQPKHKEHKHHHHHKKSKEAPAEENAPQQTTTTTTPNTKN
ncbi:rna binding protein jsn1 [Pelomyxa schiedti]|nr:rna binding protein jsn1 [Pelomyxa schiedti]